MFDVHGAPEASTRVVRRSIQRPRNARSNTAPAGFVFGVLGRLPAVGDRVAANGAVFTVREMEGRRVETLAVDLRGSKGRD